MRSHGHYIIKIQAGPSWRSGADLAERGVQKQLCHSLSDKMIFSRSPYLSKGFSFA